MSKKWQYIFTWAVVVAALVYIGYRLATYEEYNQLLLYIQSIGYQEYVYLLIALFLMPLQLYVEAHRWRTLLHGLTEISVHESFVHVLQGSVAGFITPYRVGDIPARLLLIGHTLDEWKDAIGGWKTWLKDGYKWLTIVLQTLLRYGVWGVQLGLMLTFAGIDLTIAQLCVLIPIYYGMVSILPMLPAGDIPIKGSCAVLVFGTATNDVPALVLAVSMIWLINTVLPVLWGCGYRVFCKR